MRDNMRKRAISIILAVMMTVGVMPAISPAAVAGTGGTTLAAGDIAFVGINSDGDDDFAFLLLKDIAADTSIYVTDKGWNDGTGFNAAAGDGIWQWTTATARSAGTVVHIKTSNNGIYLEDGSNLAASPGTIVRSPEYDWNDIAVSQTGDQIFLYQGTMRRARQSLRESIGMWKQGRRRPAIGTGLRIRQSPPPCPIS